jgi:hypothetical protein
MHVSFYRIALGLLLVASFFVPPRSALAQTGTDICAGGVPGWTQAVFWGSRWWEGRSSNIFAANPTAFMVEQPFDQMTVCIGETPGAVRKYVGLYHGSDPSGTVIFQEYTHPNYVTAAYPLGPFALVSGGFSTYTLTTGHDNLAGNPDTYGDVSVWVRDGGSMPTSTPTPTPGPLPTNQICSVNFSALNDGASQYEWYIQPGAWYVQFVSVGNGALPLLGSLTRTTSSSFDILQQYQYTTNGWYYFTHANVSGETRSWIFRSISATPTVGFTIRVCNRPDGVVATPTPTGTVTPTSVPTWTPTGTPLVAPTAYTRDQLPPLQ